MHPSSGTVVQVPKPARAVYVNGETMPEPNCRVEVTEEAADDASSRLKVVAHGASIRWEVTHNECLLLHLETSETPIVPHVITFADISVRSVRVNKCDCVLQGDELVRNMDLLWNESGTTMLSGTGGADPHINPKMWIRLEDQWIVR